MESDSSRWKFPWELLDKFLTSDDRNWLDKVEQRANFGRCESPIQQRGNSLESRQTKQVHNECG